MQASVAVAHGPIACGIFQDQGWNPRNPIGRQILNHWTTREVLKVYFLNTNSHKMLSEKIVALVHKCRMRNPSSLLKVHTGELKPLTTPAGKELV